jgi:hypothetical protein
MADFQYNRDPQRLFNLGMDLNRPVDALKPFKVAIAQNVRAYQAGRLEPRKGLTSLALTGSHSIRRLNDPANATYARISGHTTKLYVDGVQKDAGYSGDPLALVPYRPEQSPASWMYVADRSRMRKVNLAGIVHQIGFPAPTTYPSAHLSGFAFHPVWAQPLSGASWTYSLPGGAGTVLPTTTTRIDSASVTITAILYDTGTTGWCLIRPSDIGTITEGMDILTGAPNAETFVVQSCSVGTTTTSTISSIIFDSGSAGACSLVLDYDFDKIGVDSLLYNSTKTQYARVEAVIKGPDGKTSIRCTTPAASTWAATNVCYAVPSFRCYTVTTQAAGVTLSNVSLTATADNSGTPAVTTSFTAYVQSPKLSPLDMTEIATGVPMKEDDYINIAISLSNPNAIIQGKVMFGLYNTNTPADAFLQDYYYKPFRVSDLTINIGTDPSSYLLAQQQAQQYRYIDLSGSPEEPANVTLLVPADQQLALSLGWTLFRFKVSDLIRVGTSSKLDLHAVYYIRVEFTVAAQTVCQVGWGTVVLSGGYGLDTGSIGENYLYRYRARCSTTGAKSNWSPATRGGLYALRQAATITAPQYTAAAEADVLDFQRFGGSLPDWHYIGQCLNAASPSFIDRMDDATAVLNDSEGLINYQPFPVIGLPVTGTTTAVSGTSVTSTAAFSTSWAPGTRIEINNLVYTVYRVISTSLLELNENAGVQGAVAFRVPEPVIVSQNLPCLWGPVNETFFACGDTTNPQRLYFLNKGSESLRDDNWIDITSPSEPLMNGVVYNGRSYVWSSERLFQLTPIQREDGSPGWDYMEIPNGKGLFTRWALTLLPGPEVFFLAKDGIYSFNGGMPVSITDEDLYPLFPNEGGLGQTVNGIAPPDITVANATYLRLSYYDEFLYFDFIDTAQNRRTLVHAFSLMEGRGGWFYDSYTPAVILHYGEEDTHSLLCGGVNGVIYQYTGVADAGAAIACHFRTASRNQGDPRLFKLYGDVMLDVDTASTDVTATIGINNYTTLSPAITVNNATRTITPLDVGTAWEDGRNIALDLAWSATAAGMAFYLWEPRWHESGAPIAAYAWEVDHGAFGMEGFLYSGDMYFAYISTAALTMTFTVDGAVHSVTFPSSSGAILKQYLRLPVMKGKIWQIRVSSTAQFRVHGQECEFHVKQWGANQPWRSVRMFTDMSASEMAS